METKDMMWGVIAVLLIAVLFVSFMRPTISGNAVSSGNLDTSGWTADEKMNYEMHGVIPARVQGSAPASSSGMVGGC
ncbi:hypothetical protein J4482_02585 [Candidatus Woesearchaeota archaeon]|nr:hypothetical protein [Candidatus Woesearchaeota archaeon]